MLSRLLLLSASRPAVTAAWMQSSRRVSLVTMSPIATSTTLRAETISTTTSGMNIANTDDDSAISRSRAPFRMPRNSPDDSVPGNDKSSLGVSSWNQLGLWTELVTALTEMKLEAPTPVQNLVIPKLLLEEPVDTAFLAATGSGKTLAYCLPLLQQLKNSETFGDDKDSFQARKPKRPRLLIIAPTRELVLQIKDVVKRLCHSMKLSSHALIGGQDYGKQRKALNRPVDVIVSTPGRLIQHWREGHVFFGDVDYIVLDEMDTLLEQGFQKDLSEFLYPLLWEKPMDELNPVPRANAPRIVLTSATMTQSIQKIVSRGHDKHHQNNQKDDRTITAKRHHIKQGTEKASKMILPTMEIIKAAGLHKAVPRLEQVFVDVGNVDKISLLVDVVSGDNAQRKMMKQQKSQDGTSGAAGNHLTMVFCNTAASCRAAQFAMAEARIDSLSYHGELNSVARSENLRRFRQAGEDPTSDEPKVLVCTDLGARGLDVPQVDHVVMFDFPLNALDYLHRSGRTARGVADETTKGKGRVTALVAKRDKVLATGIENAVLKGEPLDGLSSRKSDYLPGGRLSRRGGGGGGNRDGGNGSSSNDPSNRRPRQQQQQKRGLSSKAGRVRAPSKTRRS